LFLPGPCAPATRLLLLLLLLGLPSLAQAQFTFTTNSGTLTITGYTGPGGAVIIPRATNRLPVTSIADLAFDDTTNLTNITIPDTVTNVGYHAFYYCTGLTDISVDPLNSAYSSADGVLFDKSQATLIQYPVGRGGAYTISNGVTSIEDSAFAICEGLTSVAIPNSVTSIGPDAFDGCQNLTNLAIPDYVTSIEDSAFALTALASVAIPGNVTNIGVQAFAACGSLTSVSIPDGVTSIGDYAFDQCTSLTNVTIGAGVTDIGNYAFRLCTSLTSVAIPNSATNIGSCAFFVCSSLTNVTIGNGVASIEDSAFLGCQSLKGIYFKGSAPSLGSSVFAYDSAPVYYLLETAGWGPMFAGLPTVLWNPQAQTTGAGFGVGSNGFGFNITSTNNLVVVVEAATNLAGPAWSPIQTNTLTAGSSYFNDPHWTNFPARFYRLNMP
jgi:hypothetical protein